MCTKLKMLVLLVTILKCNGGYLPHEHIRSSLGDVAGAVLGTVSQGLNLNFGAGFGFNAQKHPGYEQTSQHAVRPHIHANQMYGDENQFNPNNHGPMKPYHVHKPPHHGHHPHQQYYDKPNEGYGPGFHDQSQVAHGYPNEYGHGNHYNQHQGPPHQFGKPPNHYQGNNNNHGNYQNQYPNNQNHGYQGNGNGAYNDNWDVPSNHHNSNYGHHDNIHNGQLNQNNHGRPPNTHEGHYNNPGSNNHNQFNENYPRPSNVNKPGSRPPNNYNQGYDNNQQYPNNEEFNAGNQNGSNKPQSEFPKEPTNPNDNSSTFMPLIPTDNKQETKKPAQNEEDIKYDIDIRFKDG